MKYRDRCAGPFFPLSVDALSHADSAAPPPDPSRSRLTWGQQDPETDVEVPVARAVVPAHLLHGTSQIIGISMGRREITRIGRHEGKIIPLGHQKFLHPKPPADGHGALDLIRKPLRFVRRAAHR